MLVGHQKAELQAIAQAKIEDARILLRHGRASNAYYLAGYAIEIAIKAVIAGRMQHETIPDKQYIIDIYTHDLGKLIKLAGLTKEHSDKIAADANFGANWGMVSQWSEAARYQLTDIASAQYIVVAIDDEVSGVMPWITKYW